MRVQNLDEIVREKMDQASDSGADQFISSIRPIFVSIEALHVIDWTSYGPRSRFN